MPPLAHLKDSSGSLSPTPLPLPRSVWREWICSFPASLKSSFKPSGRMRRTAPQTPRNTWTRAWSSIKSTCAPSIHGLKSWFGHLWNSKIIRRFIIPCTLLMRKLYLDTHVLTRRALYRLGPSEFTTTGSLKNWDITGIIHKIACPTLLISAALDEMQEVAVLPFFLQIPKIKWVELRNSTHLAQFEEPERFVVFLFC